MPIACLTVRARESAMATTLNTIAASTSSRGASVQRMRKMLASVSRRRVCKGDTLRSARRGRSANISAIPPPTARPVRIAEGTSDT